MKKKRLDEPKPLTFITKPTKKKGPPLHQIMSCTIHLKKKFEFSKDCVLQPARRVPLLGFIERHIPVFEHAWLVFGFVIKGVIRRLNKVQVNMINRGERRSMKHCSHLRKLFLRKNLFSDVKILQELWYVVTLS